MTLGLIGIPCKDFGRGCQCRQCQDARTTHGGAGAGLGRLYPCRDYGKGCRCTQCQNTDQLVLFQNNKYRYLINSLFIDYGVDLSIQQQQLVQRSSNNNNNNSSNNNIIHDGVHKLSVYISDKLREIGKLPASIIELEIRSSIYASQDIQVFHDIISILPSNLKILRLPKTIDFSKNIRGANSVQEYRFPESLIDLDYFCNLALVKRFTHPPNNNCVFKNLEFRIDSIESLEWLHDNQWISSINIYGFDVELKPNQIPSHVRQLKFYGDNIKFQQGSIPLALEQLSCDSVGNIHFSMFQQLLQLRYLCVDFCVGKIDKGVLPPCLEYLRIFSFNSPLEQGVLPDSLKTLDLPCFAFHKLTAGSLPASLTKLSLESYNLPLIQNVLPSHLQTLLLISFQNTLEPLSLPSSLTELRLNSFQGSFADIGPLNHLKTLVTNTLDKSISTLVSNVNNIKIKFEKIESNFSIHSNTSIRQLSLECLDLDTSILPVASLPQSLVQLTTKNVTIRSYGAIPFGCLYLYTDIPNINRHILPTSMKYVHYLKSTFSIYK
ncbi:hypothetical protein CYY_005975 [Polysphondylium violaceum]|uniref:Uncharacterized protein n=1 Tax=Polysphondylium violaceum TaxID=133409 RepID=A0A8J4PRP3_9MYCE|nr:hypothetical protein CYY_005975 [Polysphondylium violaceum]